MVFLGKTFSPGVVRSSQDVNFNWGREPRGFGVRKETFIRG